MPTPPADPFPGCGSAATTAPVDGSAEADMPRIGLAAAARLDPAQGSASQDAAAEPDPDPESAVPVPSPSDSPRDPAAERARWRDRRTGIIALIVITVALWAVIAAAVGFATTM